MSTAPPGEGGAAGGASALQASDLFPIVYEELKALARRRLADERADHTLQATALVHEAFLRLESGPVFANRAHFFHAAAEAMRRILIEHARGRNRVKRGGGAARREPLNVLDMAAAAAPDEILSFDDAIHRLEAEAPQAAAVIRLRFYAGLSVDETAETLGISARTVNREWTFARAWLFRALEDEARE